MILHIFSYFLPLFLFLLGFLLFLTIYIVSCINISLTGHLISRRVYLADINRSYLFGLETFRLLGKKLEMVCKQKSLGLGNFFIWSNSSQKYIARSVVVGSEEDRWCHLLPQFISPSFVATDFRNGHFYLIRHCSVSYACDVCPVATTCIYEFIRFFQVLQIDLCMGSVRDPGSLLMN